MNKLILTTMMMALLATSAGAQRGSARPAPPVPPVPPAPAAAAPAPPAPPAAPAPQAVPAPPQPPAEPGAQLANIRVDLLLSDEGGPAPARKNVSLTLADRARGSVRALGRALKRPNEVGFESQAPLNVDIYARIEKDGRIRTNIVLEYQSLTGPDEKVFAPYLKGVFEPLLENGKKMLVWQAADPASDRRVSVEVTATVLK